MKECRQCGEVKAFSYFIKKKSNKSGIGAICTSCNRANVKTWASSNKERNKKRIQTWIADNRDRHAANVAKTHAVSRGAKIPEDFKVEDTIRFYAEVRHLTKMTGILHVVDHIIPCSRGGLHCKSNLQVITQQENMARKEV